MNKQRTKIALKTALVTTLVTSICILCCVRSNFEYAKALDTSEDIIAGILGAEVGVTEADVNEIVNLVKGILSVGNSSHKIPANCPDNIKDEINRLVDMNQTNNVVGTVDKYETILYGNGVFNTRIEFTVVADKYYVNATKTDGKIAIGSMDRALSAIGGYNQNYEGDEGIEVSDDSFVFEDPYDYEEDLRESVTKEVVSDAQPLEDGEYINGIWYFSTCHYVFWMD